MLEKGRVFWVEESTGARIGISETVLSVYVCLLYRVQMEIFAAAPPVGFSTVHISLWAYLYRVLFGTGYLILTFFFVFFYHMFNGHVFFQIFKKHEYVYVTEMKAS